MVNMRQRRGLYIISVAAEILEMHPQTLRKYERAGFISPPRSGTLRLYSDEDIAHLRLIKHFVEDLGLNLSGVELALKLTAKLLKVRTGIFSRGDATSDAIKGIDDILADLGLRVTQEPKPAERTALPPSQNQPAQIFWGEPVQFIPATRRTSNRR